MTDQRSQAVENYFGKPGTYLTKGHLPRVRASIVAELLSGLKPGRILDVGCGDGTISIPLMRRGHSLTLVDLSQPMLDLAAINVAAADLPRVTFRRAALEDLSGGDAFDVVLGMGLLAHVPSLPDALYRLAALTKPGGLLVVQITDRDSALGRFSYAYGAWREHQRPAYGYQLQRLSTTLVKSVAAAACLDFRRRLRYSLTLPGMDRLPARILVGLTAASRRPPFRYLAGESILVFQKQERS
jgi:SAM-dependent methyltransferase